MSNDHLYKLNCFPHWWTSFLSIMSLPPYCTIVTTPGCSMHINIIMQYLRCYQIAIWCFHIFEMNAHSKCQSYSCEISIERLVYFIVKNVNKFRQLTSLIPSYFPSTFQTYCLENVSNLSIGNTIFGLNLQPFPNKSPPLFYRSTCRCAEHALCNYDKN